MGIGRRIRDIWRSRSHRELDGDALRSSLDDTYRAQLAHLQKVRRGVADVTTSRKRVEVRLRQLEQQAATFDAQAREAVERGDDTAALGELAALLANGRLLLEAAAAGLDGVSEPRVWPHHFDTGCAQLLSDTSMVGFGLSLGDAQIDQPYFYAWPWPSPAGADLPELPAGRWDDRGEDGLFAVLPVADLPADGAAQATLAQEWLTAALAACRTLAG